MGDLKIAIMLCSILVSDHDLKYEVYKTSDKTSGVDFRHEDGTLLYPHFLGFMSFVWRFLPVTSFWKILALPVTLLVFTLYLVRGISPFYFLIQILDTSGNMFLDKEINA